MKKVYIFSMLFFCTFITLSSRCPGQEVNEEFFFTIQVGSYLNKDHARALEEKLIKKGYPAYVNEPLSETGQTIYQVRIGKFKARKDAEELALLLIKEKMSYLIIKTKSTKVASPMTTTPRATTKETTGRASTPEPPTEERDDSPWPHSISKIYTYLRPEGTLHITNKLEEIPEEFRDRIESISVFPVRFISFDPKREVLHLRIDQKEQPVRLIGVAFSSPLAITYFEKNLRDVPLRFEYSPKDKNKGNVLFGFLYFQEGKSVNLEMVRKGIAPFYPENIPLYRKQLFSDAENLARKEKAGIWAVNGKKE